MTMNLDAVFSRIYLRFTTLNASQNSSETSEKNVEFVVTGHAFIHKILLTFFSVVCHTYVSIMPMMDGEILQNYADLFLSSRGSMLISLHLTQIRSLLVR